MTKPERKGFLDTWVARAIDFWPVLITAGAIMVAGVRADAQIGVNTKRIESLETAEPHIAERLARIEQKSDDEVDALHRIEAKLDSMPTRAAP